jgi:hypothetical protein
MGTEQNPKGIAVIARPHCRLLVMARDWLVETGELAEVQRKPRQPRR